MKIKINKHLKIKIMKKITILLIALFAFLAVNAQSQCNANFTYAVDSNGYGVQFYDQSTPDTGQTIVSWFWNFGNGTSSSDQNPYVQQMQGTYNVCLTIITSDSCSSTYCDSVVVGTTNPCQGFYLTANVTNESDWQMYDGAIDLTVHGGTGPFTYSWTNYGQTFSATTEDLSGLTNDVYYITVTDSLGCIIDDDFYVGQDSGQGGSNYVDTLYAQIDSCLGNGTIDTAYVSNVNFLDSTHVDITWTFISGGATNTITITYLYNFVGSNWVMIGVNCGTKALQIFQQAVYLDGVLGIENNKIKDLVLYPNPVKDNMFIEFSSFENSNISIMITNMMGQTVYTVNQQIMEGSNTISINTNNFKSGIYFVNITNNKGILITKKFIK